MKADPGFQLAGCVVMMGFVTVVVDRILLNLHLQDLSLLVLDCMIVGLMGLVLVLLLPQPRGRGWVVRVSLVHSSDVHTRTVLVLSFPLVYSSAFINKCQFSFFAMLYLEYPSL